MDLLLIFTLSLLGLVFILIGYAIGKFVERTAWESNIDSIRQDAVKRSRSVLSGSFSEQLAPYLPGFNYSPTEVRFIGKPVDFLVFYGMDQKEIEKVVFVEVKTGKSSLSPVEKSLKTAIQEGRVEWEIYHAPTQINKDR